MEERHTSLQNPCDLCDARFLVGVLWHKLFWHSLQSKTMTLQTVPAGAYLLSIERGSFTWRTGLPNQPCSFTKEYCRTPLAPNDRIHHPQFAFKERTVLIVNFLFQPRKPQQFLPRSPSASKTKLHHLIAATIGLSTAQAPKLHHHLCRRGLPDLSETSHWHIAAPVQGPQVWLGATIRWVMI